MEIVRKKLKATGTRMDYYDPASLKETAFPRIPVLICPGGGYSIVGTSEAFPVSERFAKHGFFPFILRYTVSEGDLPFDSNNPVEFAPIQDVANALRRMQEIFPDHPPILCGFSAGAHLSLSYTALRTPEMPQVSAVILSYPYLHYPVFENSGFDILEQIDRNFPPCFVWHGENDFMVPPDGTFEIVCKLRENDVPVEFHFFKDIRHADPFYEPAWFELMQRWIG
ncbi:MAG: alpha/beta hydrolase [Clostridiales Family XIII bacterium]|jgi:acetyl esterase/lipase|nr:alpha/beta hydrolase [Clostridiales Family XIII bacterium]